MPDLDLEPRDYRVRGRKEPIFNRGALWTLLGFAVFILLGVTVFAPAFHFLRDALYQLLWGHPYPGP